MLDLRYVKKLVEMLDESSLDAIEISTEKGLKIRVSKAASAPAAAVAPATVVVPVPPTVAEIPVLRPSPAGGVPTAPDPAPAAAAPAATLRARRSDDCAAAAEPV